MKVENLEKMTLPPEYSEGKYQIPKVIGTDFVNFDVDFIDFNQVKTFKGDKKRTAVHFFIDDYRFVRIWQHPKEWAQKLAEFAFVLSPDFSIYTDMPLAMQIWKHYQKMWYSAYLESFGVQVIPTACWGLKESFEFCFDGMPKNSIVAVSSVGCMKNIEAKKLFLEGYNEMIMRLSPSKILFYGKITNEISQENIIHLSHSMDVKFKTMKFWAEEDQEPEEQE